jgi:hypothetical protein
VSGLEHRYFIDNAGRRHIFSSRKMNAIAKAAIAQVQWKHPRAQTDGFYAAVKELIRHCFNDEDANELRNQPWLLEVPRTPPCSDSELRQLWRDIYRPSFQPDLYEVDVANRQFTLYEVEDSYPLTEEKLHKIINWWFTIDDLIPGPGGVRLIV